MFLGEQSSCNASVRLRHGVLVDHASHVASVAWDLLPTNVVSGACNPVGGELAEVTEDILIDLGVCRQVNMTHHALLKRDAAHSLFLAACKADFAIDGASSLAKEVILKRNVACVAWQVLAGPRILALRAVL